MTPRRSWPALGLLAVVWLALAAPAARAAGVGGVELVAGGGSSFTVAAAQGSSATRSFTVRNIGAVRATVRLYTAGASGAGASWSVGAAGSADWLRLPPEELVLDPGQAVQRSFTAAGSGTARSGAVVLEQANGPVVQRAATLVHARPGGLSLPPAVVALAGVAAGLSGLAVLTTAGRGRRRRPPGSVAAAGQVPTAAA